MSLGTLSRSLSGVVALLALAAPGLAPAGPAASRDEVLLGIRVDAQGIEIQVASGGCTRKEDFRVEIDKGVTGQPPWRLHFIRLRPDECKAFLPEGVPLRFERGELGLGPDAFTLGNRVGPAFLRR